MQIPITLLPENMIAQLPCGCAVQRQTRKRFIPWLELVAVSESCPRHTENMVGNQNHYLEDVEVEVDSVPYRVNVYVPNEVAKSVVLDIHHEGGAFSASFKDIEHSGSFFEAVHGCVVDITEMVAEMFAEKFAVKEKV